MPQRTPEARSGRPDTPEARLVERLIFEGHPFFNSPSSLYERKRLMREAARMIAELADLDVDVDEPEL